MVNERLQGEEEFHSKNYILEMPESEPHKLNFVTAEAISKSYRLDCSCKCPCIFWHGYA